MKKERWIHLVKYEWSNNIETECGKIGKEDVVAYTCIKPNVTCPRCLKVKTNE
jgi:hypothetical protein